MRVYYQGQRANHLMYVAPAADLEGIQAQPDSAWLDDEGNPRTFEIHFKDGAADVAPPLGRYLLARGLAKRTRLILPPGVLAA